MRFVEKASFKIKKRNDKVQGVRVEGKNMTRDDIIEVVKKYTQKVQNKSDKPKEFIVSLLYPEDWYSGPRSFRAGEEPALFRYSDYDDDYMANRRDPETFNHFWIYTMTAPEQAGGNSKRNDCLYHCLQTLATGALPWQKPSAFKKFLKLDRNDKVDIKYIEVIEKRLKRYAINVIGDYTYISPMKSNLIMNLILENGHYSIDLLKSNTQLTNAFNISSKERQPIMIYKHKDGIIAYDGEEEKEITAKEYFFIDRLKTNYIHIPYTDKDVAIEKRRTLKECFDEWITVSDGLNTETNGLINMYKTGSYQNTAIRIFHFYSQCIHPEVITQHEAEFLQKATKGAIAFCQGYKGPLHSYDFTSHYPAIISDLHFLVPICQGKFEMLEALDFARLTTGIYKCIITPTIKDHYKVFRLNENNYYTHIDVKRAHELGFKIKLITDGKPNALKYYRSSCLTGSEVFLKTVGYLFELKNKKVAGAKCILNNLWGKLCQTKTRKQVIEGEELRLEDDETITAIYPAKNNQTVFRTVKKRDQYYTNYARIKPFVLAEGRAKLSRVVEPIMDDVVKCHTDSIHSKSKVNYHSIGDKLGQLSYQGYCENATVTNLSVKVSGKFEK